ncbi:MAG: thioredoxin [Planctomycetes bacterium]|nr:thioredoxin [Planctomycetota bacterium]
MQFDSLSPISSAQSPASGPAVIDVTAETFQKDVVERSLTTPVVLDFWAPWCQPCKTLSPTLEKVARESGGRVVLAKVDIDTNPELADAFGVQSVPTVALLVGGKIVDGFVGAQPEAKVREMLAKHAGFEQKDSLKEALALEKEGDLHGTVTALRAVVRESPSRSEARAHLARVLLLSGAIEDGKKVYETLSPEARELEPARAARALIDLAASRVDVVPLEAAVKAQPEDIAARLALGRAYLADNQAEKGLAELLTAARLDIKFDGGAPRKALIEAFGMLGEANPLVTQYRRELSILLCS